MNIVTKILQFGMFALQTRYQLIVKFDMCLESEIVNCQKLLFNIVEK